MKRAKTISPPQLAGFICALSVFVQTSFSAAAELCPDQWKTSLNGNVGPSNISVDINCAAEDTRIVLASNTGKRKAKRFEQVIAQAHIGTNTIFVTEEKNRKRHIYRIGIKPGDDSIFLWRYRVDKDRTPRRILQNTQPYDDNYRGLGTLQQGKTSIVIAARTVGNKDYPAVFFVRRASRGEALVYPGEIGNPIKMSAPPGAPSLDAGAVKRPGDNLWILR